MVPGMWGVEVRMCLKWATFCPNAIKEVTGCISEMGLTGSTYWVGTLNGNCRGVICTVRSFLVRESEPHKEGLLNTLCCRSSLKKKTGRKKKKRKKKIISQFTGIKIALSPSSGYRLILHWLVYSGRKAPKIVQVTNQTLMFLFRAQTCPGIRNVSHGGSCVTAGWSLCMRACCSWLAGQPGWISW